MHSVISRDWLNHLTEGLKGIEKIRIISPFITENLVRQLLSRKGDTEVEVITRYNLNDFRSKSSSISALKSLVQAGAKIKGIKGLHSKVYIFGSVSVIVSSANFTTGGFFNNHEFGIKSVDPAVIEDSTSYFNSLFNLDTAELTLFTLLSWEKELKSKIYVAPTPPDLSDYGVSPLRGKSEGKQFFIKFFGSGQNRSDLPYSCRDMVKDSHSHFALTFSGKRGRPRKYRTGDVVYLARILTGKDYAIFGRATALEHSDERDVASEQDIRECPWKEDWPVYIRISDPIFIDGSMEDCPKMSKLISDLDVEAFAGTNRRTLEGITNINPWDSLRRQADVMLTDIAAEWMTKEFETVLQTKGAIPKAYIEKLYKPVLPV